MALAWRAGTKCDLLKCVALLRGHAAYDSTLLARLPAVWRRLLADGALTLAVVEDASKPANDSLLAFACSVFVTDAFIGQERSGCAPYVTRRAIDAEDQPEPAILRARGIAAEQAHDGLNLLNLHYAEAHTGLTTEVRHHIRFLLFEAFVTQHKGYRVKELLQELWDDDIAPAFILKGWGPVRSEYKSFVQSRPHDAPRPYLLGLTREEAHRVPGWLAAPLFVWSHPRFGFSPGEQVLLATALAGETDRGLAAVLGLALPTIKSRWRAIYDRVAAVDAALLADGPRAHNRRGDEKRRRLTEYLRHHPEEVRSTCGADRAAAARSKNRQARVIASRLRAVLETLPQRPRSARTSLRHPD